MKEFDLQRYLENMERRADERHIATVEKIDEMNVTVNDHSTRLVVLEGTEKRHRWYATTTVAALIGFLFDLLLNRLGRRP